MKQNRNIGKDKPKKGETKGGQDTAARVSCPRGQNNPGGQDTTFPGQDTGGWVGKLLIFSLISPGEGYIIPVLTFFWAMKYLFNFSKQMYCNLHQR